MRMRTWLLVGFTVVPIVEILLFAWIGSAIGVWPAVAIVLLTAVIGSSLVSRQGRSTWQRFRQELGAGGVPTGPIVHGAMILVAGALLLTPGFLTDIVGLVLLVPRAREALRRWGTDRAKSRWVVLP